MGLSWLYLLIRKEQPTVGGTIPWAGDAGFCKKPIKYESLSEPESKPVLLRAVLYRL